MADDPQIPQGPVTGTPPPPATPPATPRVLPFTPHQASYTTPAATPPPPQASTHAPTPAHQAAGGPGDPGQPPVEADLAAVWRRGLPARPTARQLQAARDVRRRLAYRLWLRNQSTREIGRQLGVSNRTAWYDVEAYRLSMDRALGSPLARRRDMLVAQHAENMRGLWDIADDQRVSVQARIMARAELTKSLGEVAKLTGANAPVKVAATDPTGENWAPIAVEQLAAHFTLDELKVLERAARQRLLPATIDGEVVNK